MSHDFKHVFIYYVGTRINKYILCFMYKNYDQKFGYKKIESNYTFALLLELKMSNNILNIT